jgi:hypothetical protein
MGKELGTSFDANFKLNLVRDDLGVCPSSGCDGIVRDRVEPDQRDHF